MKKEIILTLAREACLTYLHTGEQINLSPDFPDWLKLDKTGLYFTLFDYAGNIRSQFGHFLPTQECLGKEIIFQGLACIKGGGIYKPILKTELAGLKIRIDIIINQEPILNLTQIEPQKDGLLVIKTNKFYGIALPGKFKTSDLFKIACRKARLDPENETYKLFCLKINTYYE